MRFFATNRRKIQKIQNFAIKVLNIRISPGFFLLIQKEFFIAASTYHHKHLPPNITLKIGNEHIKPSETIRNLGAFFDSHMTMSSYINNVTKTVTFHLRNIGRIRKYIDQTTCHHAARSLILSRPDYSIAMDFCRHYLLRMSLACNVYKTGQHVLYLKLTVNNHLNCS